MIKIRLIIVHSLIVSNYEVGSVLLHVKMPKTIANKFKISVQVFDRINTNNALSNIHILFYRFIFNMFSTCSNCYIVYI